jgi:hypothetical protein
LGIDSKLLRNMGYDRKGIEKRRQGIINPIVAMSRLKHGGLGFNKRGENTMTMKTTFVKVKDMVELVLSSKEKETTKEEEITHPFYPSYGIF